MAILKEHLKRLSIEQRGSAVIPLKIFELPHLNLGGWLNGRERRTLALKRLAWRLLFYKRQIILSLAIGTVALTAAYSTLFLWPRSVNFAYGQSTCVTNPLLLPSSLRAKSAGNYRVNHQPGLKVGNLPLYSHTTCVEPINQPAPGQVDKVQVSAFGNPVFKKTLSIKGGELPVVSARIGSDGRVPAHKPLTFQVAGGDIIFNYRLAANGSEASCHKSGEEIACELAPLKLVQGQSYELKLLRVFKENPASEVLAHDITTIEPVTLVSSSVGGGSTIYDSPAGLTLEFNKPLAAVKNLRLEALSPNGRQVIESDFTQEEQRLKISFKAALPRETSFELVIDQIEATDQSMLEQKMVLPFATSGGPKVAGISIGTYKIQPGGKFTINFDTPLKDGQNFAGLVSVEAGGQTVSATVSHSGSSLTVTPATLGKCTAFTVRVKAGLVNSYGIGNGQAWQYGSRTVCQTVFSIGTSVLGRSITGYRFGSGSSKIIFVGGTHGDERSSVHTMNSLVEYLEASPGVIPGHRTVVIIPNLNPDGYAMNRRTNANNVDLNRNFPSNSWKQGVTMPNGEYLADGGGTAALSEPETSALANYVLGQSPRLVLTYHSSGGMVIANESGDSWDLTATYGKKSGLWARKNSELGTTFNYDTTGAFEDWLHDKHAIPTLLIELWNDTANHFNGQRSAILQMISLP